MPVNPKEKEILGIPVINSIEELPSPLDMAVICVPPKAVLGVLESLAQQHVKAVIIITAGFKEVGKDGYYLEESLTRIAEQNNIALLGPNCLGLINPFAGLNASFAPSQPAKGNIAFFSQSGALCASILDWAQENNIGFSKFISLGNKAVLNESDMLSALVEDPETKVILGYIEGVDNGTRFITTARDVTCRKPVIMLKAGTTAAGAKAASSHTGAMAGSEQAYIAAFKQTGVIRADNLGMLFNLARCFSNQPLPSGPNLAIVTNSGGPGILAADACENSGLMLAKLSSSTVEELSSFLPSYASLYNPIDIIGDAGADRYERTMRLVLNDSRVNAMIVLASPTASLEAEATAQAIIDCAASSDKPVFGCFMGGTKVNPAILMLRDAGIPTFIYPEPAIQALEAMYEYHEQLSRPAAVEVCYRRHKDLAKSIIAEARKNRQQEIVEFQAQGILKAYELPMPRTELARTSDEAVHIADRIGYPVVLKIASPQISHKSDVDGVRIQLTNAQDVRAAFMDITSRAQRLRKDAYISGCVVQAMAPKNSKEVIVGFTRDRQFGPLIIFGLGGIYVEVLKDISYRLAPLTLDDAAEMVREVKTYPLLRGVRGEPAVNFKAIEDVLLIMSQLALDFPEISAAEFNPVLVNEESALVADIRVVLNPA